MLVQRRGDNAHEMSFYGGDGVLQVERYFATTTALPTQVMLYDFEPGTAEGEHLHLEGHDDSCSATSSDELSDSPAQLVLVYGEPKLREPTSNGK